MVTTLCFAVCHLLSLALSRAVTRLQAPWCRLEKGVLLDASTGAHGIGGREQTKLSPYSAVCSVPLCSEPRAWWAEDSLLQRLLCNPDHTWGRTALSPPPFKSLFCFWIPFYIPRLLSPTSSILSDKHCCSCWLLVY